MLINALAEAGIWPDGLVFDLPSVNGASPAGFKSLGDRTFFLAAGDECDRIQQACFVRAQLASASENQACQCQRQNGLNFQVFSPSAGIRAQIQEIRQEAKLTLIKEVALAAKGFLWKIGRALPMPSPSRSRVMTQGHKSS